MRTPWSIWLLPLQGEGAYAASGLTERHEGQHHFFQRREPSPRGSDQIPVSSKSSAAMISSCLLFSDATLLPSERLGIPASSAVDMTTATPLILNCGLRCFAASPINNEDRDPHSG